MTSKALYAALNKSVQLVWLYGPTGSGKSFYARRKYPHAYFKGPNCDFKDYNNEATVVIDDVDISARRPFILSLVKWLDPQPFPVISRYKKISIRPERIVVLSCSHPCDFRHLKPFIPRLLSNCRIVYCGNKNRDIPPSEEDFLSDTQPFEEEDLSPSTLSPPYHSSTPSPQSSQSSSSPSPSPPPVVSSKKKIKIIN